MSMSSALNNALTGLNANTRIAEVVSSNLSNVLTDGYGRRSVELSSVQVGDVGGGVRVDAVNRFVDAGLLADRRLIDASLAGQERSADILSRLQQAIGAPDDAAGIASKLAAFEGALISASSDPASPTRLSDVVARLQDIASTLQSNTRSTQALRQDADSAIAGDVDLLNRSVQQVADLNNDILRITGSGRDPSALLDARQRAIDQISDILPVRVSTRENGTVGLMTTSGFNLLDSQPVEISFQRTPTITADMTFASGALGGLVVDGTLIDLQDGLGRLDGGSLGAAFALRDKTLFEAQIGIDTLAADLIARFQDPANDPTLSAGDLGLLTDEGAVLDLADLAGLGGRIAVNSSLVTSAGGSPDVLRDGLAGMGLTAVGDPGQINRWIASLSDIRADVAGSTGQSASGRAGAFESELGKARFLADEALSFTAARWEVLRAAELEDGVDTDQELQTLLRVEQAYAANAKVIQSVDFMMQRLLEI